MWSPGTNRHSFFLSCYVAAVVVVHPGTVRSEGVRRAHPALRQSLAFLNEMNSINNMKLVS